jgi:hypothetical protein
MRARAECDVISASPLTNFVELRKGDVRRIYLLRDSPNRPFGFASHDDDDFSSSVSLFQIPDCFWDLG